MNKKILFCLMMVFVSLIFTNVIMAKDYTFTIKWGSHIGLQLDGKTLTMERSEFENYILPNATSSNASTITISDRNLYKGIISIFNSQAQTLVKKIDDFVATTEYWVGSPRPSKVTIILKDELEYTYTRNGGIYYSELTYYEVKLNRIRKLCEEIEKTDTLTQIDLKKKLESLEVTVRENATKNLFDITEIEKLYNNTVNSYKSIVNSYNDYVEKYNSFLGSYTEEDDTTTVIDPTAKCGDDWWGCAFQFLQNGESNQLDIGGLNSLDKLRELLFDIGNIIFILVTAILGVKYIWGGVDSKFSVKNSLVTLVVAAIVFYGWNAVTDILNIQGLLAGASSHEGIAIQIYDTIMYIVNILAVGGIIYIGIKYMMAGADGKAEMKLKFIPVVMGIIMVYGAMNLINFILDIVYSF